MSKFTGYDSSILEELYKERKPSYIGGYDDFLKLPVNEKYLENEINKKQIDISNNKSKDLLCDEQEKKDLSNNNERQPLHSDL